MKEIWTDMSVRRADYLRFYGESDVEAAQVTQAPALDEPADDLQRLLWIPIQGGQVFHPDGGHPTDLMPATLPI